MESKVPMQFRISWELASFREGQIERVRSTLHVDCIRVLFLDDRLCSVHPTAHGARPIITLTNHLHSVKIKIFDDFYSCGEAFSRTIRDKLKLVNLLVNFNIFIETYAKRELGHCCYISCLVAQDRKELCLFNS